MIGGIENRSLPRAPAVYRKDARCISREVHRLGRAGLATPARADLPRAPR
jgi:hypothetical protein